MKKTAILFIPAFIGMLVACHPNPTIHNIFRIAEEQMELRPDSSLNILRQIDPTTLVRRSEKARFALLYSQALDKNYIDLESDSVIAPAMAYYSKYGKPKDRAYTNYYAGCVYSNAGEVDRAVGRMIAAETYAEKTDDHYLLARIYSVLGNLYEKQHSFEEAVEMYDNAEKYFRLEGNISNVGYILYNKGIVYWLMRQAAESTAAYAEALAIFENIGDKAQASIIRHHIATELISDDSIPADSIKYILTTYYSDTLPSIPATDYAIWTHIYSRENKLDSARYFGQLALVNNTSPLNKKCGLLLQMCKVEEQTGNFRKANDYWHEYYQLFDTIVKIEKEELVQKAEKQYRNQELKYTNSLLQIRNRYTHIGWGVFVALGLLSIIMIFRHLIIKHRQFIDMLNENYEGLDERYRQLTDEMDKDSAEEASILGAIERRLTGFQQLLDKAYNTHKPQNFMQEFLKYATSKGNSQGGFADLHYVVNKRYHGLTSHLREIHPDLTDYELDMLCMLQFGFSYNGMRLLYGHDNIQSLYSRRTKIHRKLGLAPHYPLEKYLKELTVELKNREEAQKQPQQSSTT